MSPVMVVNSGLKSDIKQLITEVCLNKKKTSFFDFLFFKE